MSKTVIWKQENATKRNQFVHENLVQTLFMNAKYEQGPMI